ncbi:MAG: carboxypeptidase-like regulatory domain-containing protein, partial [Gemmatimonadota bacterium]
MRIGCAPLAAVLVILGAAGTCDAAGRAALVGRVIDPGGEGIADATIYIRRVERDCNTPCEDRLFGPQMANGLFVVRTGTQGRFTAELPGGKYEVAAFKTGYDFALTAVNTQARVIIDLSLERAPGIVLGDLPVGSPGQNLGLNWILRRSPNGVLREVDATGGPADLSSGEGNKAGGISPTPSGSPPLATSATGRHSWFGAMARSFDGQFVHRFSGGDPFGSSSAGVGDTAGRETALALSGDLRGRGSWRILGRAGKSSADFSRVSSVRRDRQTERFSAGFDYRLGDFDDLTAGIEFGTSRYSVASTGAAGHFTEQEQRVVGFHSRWDRALGRNARLFVDGFFRQAGLSAPGGTIATTSIEAHQIDGAVDRAWQAGAGVALSAGTHNLGFGIRTRSYQHDLADRIVLNYGVGYHGNFTEDAGYIVPRVGFTHDLGGDGRTVVRSMVMLRVDQPGSRPGDGLVDGDRSNREEPGRVGYLIGVERRPDERLQFAATYRYEPYRDPGAESAGSPQTDWTIHGENGLFLSDGAAAHHELDVELARAFGPVRGILSGSVG